MKQCEWNDYVNLKKGAQTFRAIFQQSRSSKTHDLPTLILVLNVEAGLCKMFEVRKEELEVEQTE